MCQCKTAAYPVFLDCLLQLLLFSLENADVPHPISHRLIRSSMKQGLFSHQAHLLIVGQLFAKGGHLHTAMVWLRVWNRRQI